MSLKTAFALVAGLIAGGASTYFYIDSQAGRGANQPVLAMSGKQYSVNQLPPAAARAIYETDKEAWERQKQILVGAAGEIYIQEKIKESGKDRQSVLMEVMELSTPTDEALQAFYEENQNRIPAPFEQVKDQIRNFLVGQELQQKREQLTERLRSELGMKVLLPEPEAPLTVIDTEGFPSKGNPSAKTTVVKFADYQCPHCGDAARTMDALMDKVGDKVRMIYMDFPINGSGISREIALGAVCADEQGRFWEYNEAAYAQQATLNDDSRLALAQELGLDMAAFNACLESERPEERVSRSENEAERLGLTGTPAFFINGKSVQPENLGEGLELMIKQAAGMQ